jgi:spermidine/putrescine transport system permease protein
MARTAGGSNLSARPGRRAPWLLSSPGLVWLAIFFIFPLFELLRIALSTKPNPFLPDYELTWAWENFSTAYERYGNVFVRSFVFAGIATVICLVIAYPVAYFIAFRGGRYRNILLGLVMVPFFTSFLLRTIAWQSLLADQGPVLGIINALGLDGAAEAIRLTDSAGRILNRPIAVIGGLTYNFLPFMLLPIYVSLEKIDARLVDAASDLYSPFTRTFRRVIFPLSLPGVFAGTLLTFIPASGDFINSELLGGARGTKMIGSVIQEEFLDKSNYPVAAAISFVLMGIITVGVLVYTKVFGTEELA